MLERLSSLSLGAPVIVASLRSLLLISCAIKSMLASLLRRGQHRVLCEITCCLVNTYARLRDDFSATFTETLPVKRDFCASICPFLGPIWYTKLYEKLLIVSSDIWQISCAPCGVGGSLGRESDRKSTGCPGGQSSPPTTHVILKFEKIPRYVASAGTQNGSCCNKPPHSRVLNYRWLKIVFMFVILSVGMRCCQQAT
jgi:hypothetical protein